MQLATDRFRCDLCGEFRTLGVTEDHPSRPQAQTRICVGCVGKACDLIQAHAAAGEPQGGAVA